MAVTYDAVDAGVFGRRMTLDEFLVLPEVWPALEYDGRTVTQKVAPQGKHVFLQSEIVERVNAVTRPGKVALALGELRATYGGLSRVPDVSVYLWHRLPRSPDGQIADRFTEPPDIAVEIVSPGQSMTDLIDKCVWYVRNGVRIALAVDTYRATVLRIRRDAAPDVLRGEDRIDLDEVLPGFELTVSELFSSLVLD
jgi:Uma2 family endonuclease